MCGISGIVQFDGQPVDNELLTRMNDLIIHRGPDGDGRFVEAGVGLAHRRLAILDLRHEGDQPMLFQDRLVIVYNGEVYNYIELRDELIAFGYEFSTTTDTEVILAAYDHWGEECVQRFNGMWGFAIFDRRAGKLFCSRDRFGIKPFYYRQTADGIRFGSEIKQLLDEKPKANQALVIEYLVSGILDHSAGTMFDGVLKLLPGHNLVIDLAARSVRAKQYYAVKPDPAIAALDQAAAVIEVRSKFEQSIRYRLRADVKVGTCLSGGVDSSSVASCAATQLREANPQGRFSAITAIATEPKFDESAYAKSIVDKQDLDWFTVTPTSDDFRRSVDEVVYTQEEPFGGPSIFMQYFVMREAKARGCKVMLDGQGGDETLLGYQKYYPAAYYAYAAKYGIVRGLSEAIRSSRTHGGMSLKWVVAYTVASFFAAPRKWVVRRKVRFIRKEWRDLAAMRYFDEVASSVLNVFTMQRLEIEKTNLPILLRYEDKNSMRHSVEARVPFMDYQFVETALNVSIEHKIHEGWTKFILRKAMEPILPPEIAWRRDNIGFNAPEQTWLSENQESMLDETSRSTILQKICDMPAIKSSHHSMDNKLKWRLFNLAVWERIYDVQWH